MTAQGSVNGNDTDASKKVSVATSTSIAAGRPRHCYDNNDNTTCVSGLSIDESRSVASKGSLWSQAVAILFGQLPETTTSSEIACNDLLECDRVEGIPTRYLHNRGDFDHGVSSASSITATIADGAHLINTHGAHLVNTHVDRLVVSSAVLDVLDVSERLTRESRIEHQNILNFLDDDPVTMTYSRRLALFLLRRYPWYNPHLRTPSPNADEKTASETAPLPQRKFDLVHIDSYPFTHSKRERPSLQKAWA